VTLRLALVALLVCAFHPPTALAAWTTTGTGEANAAAGHWGEVMPDAEAAEQLGPVAG
jgi:hypothetical protein